MFITPFDEKKSYRLSNFFALVACIFKTLFYLCIQEPVKKYGR